MGDWLEELAKRVCSRTPNYQNILDALREAHREALEEAATLCDTHAPTWSTGGITSQIAPGLDHDGMKYAAAIRALAAEEQGDDPAQGETE